MNDRIKATFDAIHANDELKIKTRAFIAQKAPGYTTRRVLNYCRIFAVVLVFCLLAGIKLYFTPTAGINIEINLSIELGINCFNKVVSVNPLNGDGKKLAETLDIKFADYDEAFRRILNNKNIETLLSDNEIMTVTVIETKNSQSANILSEIRSCSSSYSNVYCNSASSEEASVARELGLPCGKYRAYMELHELDPDITPEEICNMTMRQIRELISDLSENSNNESLPTTSGNGHHGNGYGHGHGNNE